MNEPKDTSEWLELGRLAELGLLSGSLVHELKQPLFAIKAWLQLSCSDDPKADLLRQRVMEQVLYMEKLLGGYGGMTTRPGDWREPLRLEVPARIAMDTLRSRADKLGVRLGLTVSEDLPVLHGNPVAAQQIMVNLLQNALDAVTGAEDPEIWISLMPADGGVLLCVRDNGEGISPAAQERILEPFFTTKPPGRGTGLGLTIVSKLVELASGELEISSQPGETVVSVRYPGGERGST